jgi:hypothetical protein
VEIPPTFQRAFLNRECASSNPPRSANQSGHSPRPPDWPRKARIWRAFVHLGKSLGGEIDPGRRQIPESLRPTVSIFPFSGVCGYSLDSLNVVQEDVDGFHVERESPQTDIAEKLNKHRVVSIGGLPGCGKSAVLKRFAQNVASAGPVLLIKNDRIDASNWYAFATSLGLSNTDAVSLLQEIGSTGTPILFIDGIDRVRPDHQGVITDLVNKIATEPSLSHWKVLVSSRDQGLEAFRAWFPTALYARTGIGDVMVGPFTDDEAKQLAQSKPHLKDLLFGNDNVQSIARRPFFAAVLAHSIPEGTVPQTEVDLIDAWWKRAGHDAVADTIPQRQRALIDIAEHGVGRLGKSIPTRDLKDATHAQIAALKGDHIIRDERGGSLLAFAHDIFFEWAFLRLLIDLGDGWMKVIEEAGEPPLLGRVVGLMAQKALIEKGMWTQGYRLLEQENLRRQWQREWLTAPPFTPAFDGAKEEFSELLKADNYALLEKVLVWFQAQHTIPSPILLGQIRSPVEGVDNLAIADMLGWPSDFKAWGRLIDWIIAEAASFPVRLIPKILEVFGVWQNVFSTIKNARSKAILTLANDWLLRFEQGTLRDSEDGGSVYSPRKKLISAGPKSVGFSMLSEGAARRFAVSSLQPGLGLRAIYGGYFEAPEVIRMPLHGIGVQGRELCSDRHSTCDCSRGAASRYLVGSSPRLAHSTAHRVFACGVSCHSPRRISFGVS